MTERQVTAEPFLTLPPDERHTQLIDGEIVVTDSTFRHQRIMAERYRLLATWLLENPGHGEAGIGCNYRIDDRNVFVPDTWWVSEGRRPGRNAAVFDGAPDLVAEVRSPSTWRFDIGRKKRAYERSGVAELWLADTEADTVLVFGRSSPTVSEFDVDLEVGVGEHLSTPLLPGLDVDLRALFDR